MEDAFIQVRDLVKEFPGVKALKGVSFDIRKGSIHCVVGENGAGKSTFIKILTGAYTKSSGMITLDGEVFEPKSIRDAMNRGISVLYQELNVVDDLTTEENLSLGQEKSTLGFIRKNENTQKVMETIWGMDQTIKLHMPVYSLSVAQKQVIEIAKAINSECSVLVMDEPTASLSEDEVRRLFINIKKLKSKGITIIFISHKLSEIFEIGDYVTVFRDGHMVGDREVRELRASCGSVPESCVELVRMMIGKVVQEEYVPSKVDYSKKVLEVRHLSNRRLSDISFDLYRGEILGFYGLVGAGKTEIGRVLFGIDPYDGEIWVNGDKQTKKGVRSALKNGVAMIPEERRSDGIFSMLSIRENIPMMNIKTVLSKGLISYPKERKVADRFIQKMSIAARDREQSVVFLSGGNQQKVVIAKCLNRESDIILMDEPTRGVDVGAKEEIHNIIRSLSKEGKSVIVFSSELPEVIHLCDRIVLMHEGRIGEIMENRKDIDSDHIMQVIAGGN